MEYYYRIALYILFGILPSLTWLFYYLNKDLHPEPKKMIIKIFFWGVFITVPVFVIQVGLSLVLTQLEALPFFITYPFLIGIIKWFIIIALTEELLKYAVVRMVVFKSRELDEPLDMMLYMVVVALGFAALENILYLFSPVDGLSFNAILQTTAIISFIRFVGATFLHTLCSAVIGYFLALSFFNIKKRTMLTIIGIVLAVLLHGFYDFSIMTLQSPFAFIIPASIILGLAVFMLFEFDTIKKVKGICNI
jgi:RsiW-degrading membrane proteinase PrsW (M82 family)